MNTGNGFNVEQYGPAGPTDEQINAMNDVTLRGYTGYERSRRQKAEEAVKDAQQKLDDLKAAQSSAANKQDEAKSQPSWVSRSWERSKKEAKKFAGSTKLAAEGMFTFGFMPDPKAIRTAREAWMNANESDQDGKGHTMKEAKKEHYDKLTYEAKTWGRKAGAVIDVAVNSSIGLWNSINFESPISNFGKFFAGWSVLIGVGSMSRATEDVFRAYDKRFVGYEPAGVGADSNAWNGTKSQAAVITYIVKLGIHGSSVYLGMARMFGPQGGLIAVAGVLIVSLAIGYAMYRNEAQKFDKSAYDRPMGATA